MMKKKPLYFIVTIIRIYWYLLVERFFFLRNQAHKGMECRLDKTKRTGKMVIRGG